MSIFSRLLESAKEAIPPNVAKLFWSSPEPPKAADPSKVRQRAQHVPTSLYGRGSQVDAYFNYLQSATNRIDKYDVYDAMDEESDVCSVLDGYAEDATQVDHDSEHVVWVEGDDQGVVDELNFMLHNSLKIDSWAESNARDIAKAGDDFGRIVTNDDGIISIEWLNPRVIERIENNDGMLLGFEWVDQLESYIARVRAAKEGDDIRPSLAPWDIIHFRLYRRKRLPNELTRNIYGTSILVAAEKPAKRVKILDDILMITRLTRAMDRHLYKIDVGNSAVEEVVRTLKAWKRALKRREYIDPASGSFDSRFDPLAFTEDVFMPVKQGTASDVSAIPGITNITDIADIDQFINKLFGALRAPKADYGYEGESDLTKTTSNRSVKWARSVVSLQKAMKDGYTRLCQIHLALKGMETDTEKFKVMMVSPSSLEMLERLEAWQTLVDVADRMVALGDTMGFEKRAWSDYILRNVLWLSKQEIEEVLSHMKVDTGEGGEVSSGSGGLLAGAPELPGGAGEGGEGKEEGGGEELPAEAAGRLAATLVEARQKKNGHNKKRHISFRAPPTRF